MSARKTSPPSLLEIRKYPNRRYYDATHSRHLSLASIHQLVQEGHDVRVVEAKTGEDITVKVLTQILLEYEPVKLGLFSSELLIRAIRVKDRMLADFVDLYFKQAFEAFCSSRSQFEGAIKETQQLTSSLAHPMSWAGQLIPAWLPQAQHPGAAFQQALPPVKSDDDGKETETVREEIAAMRKELSELKEKMKKPGASRPRSRAAERKSGK